jgi:hypothetical protein
MDIFTEHILLEAKIIDSVKRIIPTAQNALMKGDFKTMKRIAKRIPKKDFYTAEKEAMKKLPRFRENYKNMQRLMVRNPNVKGIENPAALVAAVAVSISDNVTPELIIVKLSEVTKNAQKLIFFPGDIKLLKLMLFIMVLLLVYTTKGAIVFPALQYLFAGISILMGLLAKLFTGAADMIAYGRDHGPEVSNALAALKQGMDDAISTTPPGTAGLF